MFQPPWSPVGHAQKVEWPAYSSVPLQLREKPGVGAAPASHCYCVVGGVRMQPRPLASMRPAKMSVAIW